MYFKDYYKILEINFPSNEGEIKSAYRRLSLKWHPDKNPGVDTSNWMIDVNEAYYILNNPDKKKRILLWPYKDKVHWESGKISNRK